METAINSDKAVTDIRSPSHRSLDVPSAGLASSRHQQPGPAHFSYVASIFKGRVEEAETSVSLGLRLPLLSVMAWE